MDQFNHNTFETDIERLGREIKEKKSTPEIKNYSEKDLIKQSLKPMIYPQVKPAAPPPKQNEEDKFLPDYLKDAPPETKNQVEKFLEDTVKQGIEKGIAEAKKSNPFILDAFHDALTDKLYDELKKRDLI